MTAPTPAPDPRRLVALLADPVRLRVLAALVLARPGGARPAELAEAAGVPLREVMRTLSRLAEAGLAGAPDASRGGDTWRAVPETFAESAKAAARQQRDDALPATPAADPATADLLRPYFAHGRLTHVPVPQAKRMAVLDYLAQVFEPGVRYPEAEVNKTLGKFHDDHAALRRYLVDAGFLGRSESVYWRIGGTVGL